MTMALLVTFINESVNNSWRQFYFTEVLRTEGLVCKENVVPYMWDSETRKIGTKQVDRSNNSGVKKITKLTF